MAIRTFQEGDDQAQVSIYNEAAAGLPQFQPATVDGVRRRIRTEDFDPKTRFVATEQGEVIGYAEFRANGRVSFPWCRKGHEDQALPLFQAVLEEMARRSLSKALAAYRADWPSQCQFFLEHGFCQKREMINFVQNLTDMPTPGVRAASSVVPMEKKDVAGVLALGEGLLQVSTTALLEKHLLANPFFSSDSVFVVPGATEGLPKAVGLLVLNSSYAHPERVDGDMPCFRLGAFGTEGMETKKINDLFSFMARPGRHCHALGLEMLGHALHQLFHTPLGVLAAQVPSDAPHLLRFLERFSAAKEVFLSLKNSFNPDQPLIPGNPNLTSFGHGLADAGKGLRRIH
jgi:hypothetical protein